MIRNTSPKKKLYYVLCLIAIKLHNILMFNNKPASRQPIYYIIGKVDMKQFLKMFNHKTTLGIFIQIIKLIMIKKPL